MTLSNKDTWKVVFSERILSKIADRLALRWRDLAYELEFTWAEVSTIQADHKNSVKDAAMKMLIEYRYRWAQREEKEELINEFRAALSECKMNDILKFIDQELMSAEELSDDQEMNANKPTAVLCTSTTWNVMNYRSSSSTGPIRTKYQIADITAKITKWKGETRVDIRKYRAGHTGEYPTKKGVSFNSNEWKEFKSIVMKINKDAGSLRLQITHGKFEAFSDEFKYICVRKCYQARRYPRKQGLIFQPHQWQEFQNMIPQIDEALLKYEGPQ